jgi:hypothetical protein
MEPLLVGVGLNKHASFSLINVRRCKKIVSFARAEMMKNIVWNNGTARIRHQCRKTDVLSCHRFLINSGVEKMNNI